MATIGNGSVAMRSGVDPWILDELLVFLRLPEIDILSQAFFFDPFIPLLLRHEHVVAHELSSE